MEKDMEIVSHSGHPHPLMLSKLDRKGQQCMICREELSSYLVYRCQICNYFICRFCSKLPQQMKHPFHPEHTLILLEKKSLDSCRACAGTTGYGYVYDCDQCGFCLDLRCAALMPTEKYKEGKVLPDIMHQHPLIVCENPGDSRNRHYGCRRCFDSFRDGDLIYACLECVCLLDEKCAALPNQTKHIFHPEHILTLLPQPPTGSSSKCQACHDHLFPNDAVYHCSLCGFILDLHCASLTPTSESLGPDQVTTEIPIQPVSHPHPLIQFSSSLKHFKHECYGCGLPFQDSIFACRQCGILLHKACTDLPLEILHPFHLQHSLRLYENSTDDRLYRSFDCGACHSGSGLYVYVCGDCDFLLDLRCATSKFLFVKSEIHQHPLAYFDTEIREFRCNSCYRICHKHLFRCVECNFNIHNHCLPSLPKTIKHDCHIDPLTFTTSKIKDDPNEDEDTDFYCNACENTRKLADPTYYCAECHFVAHVHCVFSEILPFLQTESSLAEKVENIKVEAPMTDVAGDDANVEDGSTVSRSEQVENADIVHELNQDIEDLKKNIDSLTAKIYELMERRSQRIVTLQQKQREQLYYTRSRQGIPVLLIDSSVLLN